MKRYITVLALLASCLMALTCEDIVQPVKLCVFPDTQNLAAGVFTAQVQDCVEHRTPDFLVHLGDVGNTLTTPQWDEVPPALLGSGKSFTVALGNHDYNHLWKDPTRFLTAFNHASYPWIAGVSGQVQTGTPKLVNLGANLNYYSLIPTVTGHTYLLITVMWFSTDPGVVAWVNGVLEQYPTLPAIITLHSNLDTLSATVAPTVVPADMTNCGPSTTLWDDVLDAHANVFLVINGHAGVVFNEPDCATVRTNAAGLPVVEMLVNYPHRPPTEGCYRIVTVAETPGYDSVQAKTYCVGLEAFETDANSDYLLTGVHIAERRLSR